MTTYTPRGDGHCAECGHDVGRHIDKAHKFVSCDCGQCQIRAKLSDPPMCGIILDESNGRACSEPQDAAIHDVGLVLTCPEEASDE